MLDDLFRKIFYQLLGSDLRLAHRLLVHCASLERMLQGDPQNKEEIRNAKKLCTDAVQWMLNGRTPQLNNPRDRVAQALEAVRPFVLGNPEAEKVRQSAVAAALETFTKTVGTFRDPSNVPITVNICKSEPGSQITSSTQLSYSFSADAGYTLDDLVFVVRLRHPDILTNPPYLYSRPVDAHRYTHQGSKFERKTESDSLDTLALTGPSRSGLAYMMVSDRKFILLVKGVPRNDAPRNGAEQANATQDDKFHIIHGLNDPITAELVQNNGQKRAFRHYPKGWKYIFGPNEVAAITWNDISDQKRLKLFQGEWIVCVG